MSSRSILDSELNTLREHILRLSSLVDEAIDKSMQALITRDLELARQVVENDHDINELRYTVENESLRILATQMPAARDLRMVVATMHIAVELERMGDHAAGIASLVGRMEMEAEIDSLHQLPKMAKRARRMIDGAIIAYMREKSGDAEALIERDAKLDKNYNKFFSNMIADMRDNDDEYLHRGTYLLWVGHNLERIGDRATNIAERVIFMATGLFNNEVTVPESE